MTQNRHAVQGILVILALAGTGCGSDDGVGMYTVRFETDGTEGAVLEGALLQEVRAGDATAPVKAVPPPGYVFFDWQGGAVSQQSTLVVTNVQQDMTLRAAFRAQRVLYVNAVATGQNTGDTWTDAYLLLAPALITAQPGDEVWVAAGTYHPTTGGAAGPDKEREHYFHLKSNVGVYGGFAGTESARADRNLRANRTVLSGDIGVAGDPSDNSFSVFYNLDIDRTAVLDGFVITGGNANGGAEFNRGGGMYNVSSSPTVRNCTFQGNQAAVAGGGMANRSDSYPHVINTVFEQNRAPLGGGMANLNSTASSTLVVSSLFVGNVASQTGGGMYNREAPVEVVNCTFALNAADSGLPGTSILNDSGVSGPLSQATIRNTIFWSNDKTQQHIANNNNGGAALGHSLVVGGLSGGWNLALGLDNGGNIDVDPLFINPVVPGGDWRLRSGSPAIDAGINVPFEAGGAAEGVATDLDSNPRAVQSTTDARRVDIGAYEHQAAAACQYRPSSGTTTVKRLAPSDDPSTMFMTFDFAPADPTDFQWLGLPDDGTKVTFVSVLISAECVTQSNLIAGSTFATTFKSITQGTCGPLIIEYTGLPQTCW